MKKIVLLGATGSIGQSTLRVVEALPDAFQLVGLSAARNTVALFQIARKFNVQHIAISNPYEADKAARDLPKGMILHRGEAGLVELAALAEADIVLCAISGMAGLMPVLSAMSAGHDVALATKEVLVAAGDYVMQERARCGVNLLPVDSEHSALFQCLQSRTFEPACVRRSDAPVETYAESRIQSLILTASGGPFYAHKELDWRQITRSEALCHPRWKMGAKVTIDSATMMNKGLEMIEAYHLYQLPEERIKIWVHPQSIVHSLVHFVDGSYMAQLAPPDMCLPIQFAMTYPERLAVPMPELDLLQMRSLTFDAPDLNRFPCLTLAREAIRSGGSHPTIMNAANEVVVEAFLQGRITADRIATIVESVMTQLPATPCRDAADYKHIDSLARRATVALL